MQKYDDAFKLFATTDLTLQQVCEQLGLKYSTVSKVSSKEKWKDKKKRLSKKRINKKIDKIIDRQAISCANKVSNAIEKEIALSNAIMREIKRALDDHEQFNRQLITIKGEKIVEGVVYNQWIEEHQYKKLDAKSLLDITKALQTVQQINANAQRTLSKYEEEKLKIEHEKLDIEKRKLAMLEKTNGDSFDNDVGVLEIPALSIEEYEKEAEAAMAELMKKENEQYGSN